MFKQIDYQEALALISSGKVLLLDARDQESYDREHIKGALHLTMPVLQDLIETMESEQPILVYCYHGITSQSVAEHLFEQGFTDVYSLTGGFEKWSQHQHLEKKHDQ
jgi:thiosulfate sulfurtransferase